MDPDLLRASSAAPSGSQRGSAAVIAGAECDRESASNTAIAGSVASVPFANGTSTSNRDGMNEMHFVATVVHFMNNSLT